MDRREPGTRPQIIKTRRYTWLLPLIAVIAIGVVGIRYLNEPSRDRNIASVREHGSLRQPAEQEESQSPSAARAMGQDGGVATSGTREPAILNELETITGTVDGRELIGRRVVLHVPVEAAGGERVGNTVTYWAGTGDNRLLVVFARDQRDDEARLEGRPSNHELEPVREGVAAISGTIERVPDAEDRYSWKLTRQEEQELLERNIYLRADRITANGQDQTDAGAQAGTDTEGREGR